MACVHARYVISMAWMAIIMDKDLEHFYLLFDTECDCLLRFTFNLTFFITYIFLTFSFQPQIVLNLFLVCS